MKENGQTIKLGRYCKEEEARATPLMMCNPDANEVRWVREVDEGEVEEAVNEMMVDGPVVIYRGQT